MEELTLSHSPLCWMSGGVARGGGDEDTQGDPFPEHGLEQFGGGDTEVLLETHWPSVAFQYKSQGPCLPNCTPHIRTTTIRGVLEIYTLVAVEQQFDLKSEQFKVICSDWENKA
ncbi:unnamed protein product [Gadus morhua 'NCC']